eukprot:1160883-Pelagomonas_calceolata.AAC.6
MHVCAPECSNCARGSKGRDVGMGVLPMQRNALGTIQGQSLRQCSYEDSPKGRILSNPGRGHSLYTMNEPKHVLEEKALTIPS